MAITFGIAGGGQRAAELGELLRREGHAVFLYGVEGADASETPERVFGADALILPVPLYDADGKFNCPGLTLYPTELIGRLRPGQRVMGGLIPPETLQLAREAGVSMTDYMTRETMTVANAAITADAALWLTVQETRETLSGKRCLVLGYGRIGKLLCRRLQGVGAYVTCAARNPVDRTYLQAFGVPALDTSRLAGRLPDMQVVYNTIPAPTLGAELLRELPPDCFLMDLASRPGIDRRTAAHLGLSCVWARGLPGRVAPKSAAAVLRDTAYQILME